MSPVFRDLGKHHSRLRRLELRLRTAHSGKESSSVSSDRRWITAGP